MYDHSFVVLAYKESRYLEQCILSVINQGSEVLIATSTPSDYISSIAEKYNLPIKVNHSDKKGIGSDFEFAVEAADTQFVTIAHQDDTYESLYAEKVLSAVTDDTIIAFTNCHEMHNNEIVRSNTNLRIKRILLNPMRHKIFQRSKWVRRRSLSLGNGICCPSVTFNKAIVPEKVFTSPMRSNLDWAAWEELSRLKGRFVYIPDDLMMHRVHEESETSSIIKDNSRCAEDYEMFCRFWPKGIAKVLTKIYSNSEKNNEE